MARHITRALYFNPKDATHLNKDGLNNLRTLIEEKLLYNEPNKRGNDKVFDCKI